MTKEKAQNKSKKWSKIWVLNWLTIFTFLVCLGIIVMEEALNFFSEYSSTWSILNFQTWRPIHFIGLATGTFLMVEQVALLKTKKIDLINTAKDLEGLTGKGK